MAHQDFNDITPAGYARLQQDIADLIASRPAKIQALAEARALGDLSENAEYSAAKRDLRHLESRLRFLNKQLQYARVITPTDDATVSLGKQITVRFLDDGEQATYTLGGSQEADITAARITSRSPLGHALLGHTTGDVVTVQAPTGAYQLEILVVALPPRK